jgi:ketosteroid isomerase-like protein
MSTRVLLCALAAAVACQHGGGAHSPQTPATPAEVVTAGRTTIEHWQQAQQMRSADALAKLYAHEPNVVVVRDGQPLVGWGPVEAMLRDKLARAKEIRVRLKDVTVTSLAPTVATAAATMTRETSDGITTVTENGALTVVLRRDDDGWKIVLEHYSYQRP